MTNEIKNEMPPNYDELRKAVNRASNWRLRLDTIEELGQWKHKRTIDILLHRMNNDAVYKVVEAAHRNLVKFGEDVELPPRNRFELIKDANKVFLRIKKSLPRDHTFEEYKEKLKNMRLDLYDTYEGDKGDEFEAWLENVWETANKK
ncbi:HEAT repeat domain-containing protein [Sporosarcina sp. E16_8]|uniref:HEAT repeat domain-containing protein n=1 Tax=Sporosarcina sp. E16_8 TaxID=2789295 RepID=UPI002107FD60|nr:HEAT repeat domain-containing protein [Sporosarcina sp. E16_8]